MATVQIPAEYEKMPLSEWYADPMPPEQAQMQLEQSHVEEQAELLNSRQLFCPRIKRLIARFWLGKNIENEFRSLGATYRGEYEQALLQLVYGQLLISRKTSGAMGYLSKGFELATPFLTPSQYFVVMKRHQALANLVLRTIGYPAASLDTLLSEGKVIGKLKGAKNSTKKVDHKDTIG